MLTAHAEASEKWCPMVRVDNAIGGTANRGYNAAFDAPYPERYKCIASDCMMWRWGPTVRGQDARGYCGLAGKPASL